MAGPSSTDPCYVTRAELCSALGCSPTELDTLERQKIIWPSVGRVKGDTRPVLFSPIDGALASVALRASRLGIKGRHLTALMDKLRTRQARLGPGWRGWAVFDDAGIDLVDVDADVGRFVRSFRDPTSLLFLPITIPDDQA